MGKRSREWNPRQGLLMPPSPMEWLEEGHLAYFILEVVEEVSLAAIDDEIERRDGRGTRPYASRMMLALLLYGYCTGVYSSRRIERATYENVAFRVLAAGQHPHFTRLSEFRLRHLGALPGLFLQIFQLCQKAGMVELGHVALDGTKVQANASKHKAMSYERMTQEEERLTQEIERLLEQAAATDRAEDTQYGPGERIEDLPAELRRREQRRERIREAKAALEQEAALARAAALREQAARATQRAATHADPTERQRAATVSRHKEEQAQALEQRAGEVVDEQTFVTEDGLPTHRVATTTAGEPAAAAQRNFTDPESRIMERGGTFLQGFNGQLAVDEAQQVIVACALSNQSPDNGNLGPLLALVEKNCGRLPTATTADSGYWEPEAITRYENATQLLVATERSPHGKSNLPSGSATTEDVGPLDEAAPGCKERMQQRLRSAAGRAIYARRKVTVEPVFGQMKEARGLRRFLLRGLRKAQGEWTLLSTCHNLRKLFGAGHWPQSLRAAA